jgi:SAM-dependent methyltransferase
VISSAKAEIRKQWDADPCGASTAPHEQPGTRAFYEQVRQYRYRVYAPWLDPLIESATTPRRRILEIGVGLGSDHWRFASAGNSMVALDLSREHLRQTRRHLELEGLFTRPVYGDAECTGFADESFDLVYSFGVIHHTPSPSSAVKEIHRILRPGGVAIVAVYHRYSLNLLWFVARNGLLRGGLFRRRWSQFLSEIEYRKEPTSAVPLVKLFSRREAKQLFAGFKNVQISTHHVELPPLHRRWPNSRMSLEHLGRLFGWYVVVRAER